MASYIFLIIQFLIAVGASLGTYSLVRLTLRAFRKKEIIKGVGFCLATLIVALLAFVFILAAIGGIINILK